MRGRFSGHGFESRRVHSLTVGGFFMVSYILLGIMYLVGFILVEFCTGDWVYVGFGLLLGAFILLSLKVIRMGSDQFSSGG